MKQGMLRRPPLRTIKLYHHCTIACVRAINAVALSGALRRWLQLARKPHLLRGMHSMRTYQCGLSGH